jgi:hypothetical protein
MSESELPSTDPVCGLCGRPARGFAFAGDVRLCHPDSGTDCYQLVTQLQTPLPDGRIWSGGSWEYATR